ncbi:hypothetical protein [Halorubrum sp. HHNYT27]|uniref:hypothetical protein n=1 Tax=Halorubrum sp. HHNYT27 TaxID=3402275 RepID=UPI003EBAEB11
MTDEVQQSGVRSWIDRHRLVAFLLITYSFMWVIQGIVATMGLKASWTQSILIGFGGFGPLIGAAVVIWASGGDLRKWIGQFFKWRIGTKWWVIVFGLPF